MGSLSWSVAIAMGDDQCNITQPKDSGAVRGNVALLITKAEFTNLTPTVLSLLRPQWL